MNKTVLGVIIAVIVLGLIAYFAFGNKKASAPENGSQNGSQVESQTQQASQEQQASTPQSLKELVLGGKAMKCTFSDQGTSGTFYVASGKVRGDYSSTAAGQTVAGHMIVDGQTSYVWTEGQKQGFKISVDKEATASVIADAESSQGVNYNEKLAYSCNAWSADSSMFSLPVGIQFMDLGQIQGNMPTNIPGR